MSKIDTPVMFSNFNKKYRVYEADQFKEFLTLSSANFHASLVNGIITEAVYVGKELVQEIEL